MLELERLVLPCFGACGKDSSENSFFEASRHPIILGDTNEIIMLSNNCCVFVYSVEDMPMQ